MSYDLGDIARWEFMFPHNDKPLLMLPGEEEFDMPLDEEEVSCSLPRFTLVKYSPSYPPPILKRILKLSGHASHAIQLRSAIIEVIERGAAVCNNFKCCQIIRCSMPCPVTLHAHSELQCHKFGQSSIIR